ncbi:HNH endonuclease [Psychrobacter frigidicola]|uniref:HNH endonuclease n=1 Tax=Psychrobacter frigidicola TaxID=45611 RepID=A0A5C7A2U3_9GAMM|nr:HNH endonuclease [Psychrobacter frigidicola]TXD96952.1 HNH endonuclease [Psychrobacter frigidicola]
MRRIKTEIPSSDSAISLCHEGIKKDKYLKNRFYEATDVLKQSYSEYKAKALVQELYSLRRYDKEKNTDLVVISNLLHSEMTKIYTNFFAKQGKPARKIYDKIMTNALGICFYCGIGSPIELDHYLPKAKYPQFSISPLNLVPSCERCNKYGKGSGFATIKDNQILHPYLDEKFYFEEQWLSARFILKGNIDIVVEYDVNPPTNWENFQKRRVKEHFRIFNLGERFSASAGEQLSVLLPQISATTGYGLNLNDVCEILLDPVIYSEDFPTNHWQKIMYIAAKEYITRKHKTVPCMRCAEGTIRTIICNDCEGFGYLSQYALKGLRKDMYDLIICPYCAPYCLNCLYCNGSHNISLLNIYQKEKYIN